MLTLNVRIPLRVLGWTVAFRFVVAQHSTSGIMATSHAGTRIKKLSFAQAAPLRVPNAALHTLTLVATAGQLLANGVLSAWIFQTHSRCNLFTIDCRITHVARRA